MKLLPSVRVSSANTTLTADLELLRKLLSTLPEHEPVKMSHDKPMLSPYSHSCVFIGVVFIAVILFIVLFAYCCPFVISDIECRNGSRRKTERNRTVLLQCTCEAVKRPPTNPVCEAVWQPLLNGKYGDVSI